MSDTPNAKAFIDAWMKTQRGGNSGGGNDSSDPRMEALVRALANDFGSRSDALQMCTDMTVKRLTQWPHVWRDDLFAAFWDRVFVTLELHLAEAFRDGRTYWRDKLTVSFIDKEFLYAAGSDGNTASQTARDGPRKIRFAAKSAYFVSKLTMRCVGRCELVYNGVDKDLTLQFTAPSPGGRTYASRHCMDFSSKPGCAYPEACDGFFMSALALICNFKKAVVAAEKEDTKELKRAREAAEEVEKKGRVSFTLPGDHPVNGSEPKKTKTSSAGATDDAAPAPTESATT